MGESGESVGITTDPVETYKTGDKTDEFPRVTTDGTGHDNNHRSVKSLCDPIEVVASHDEESGR